MMTGGTRSRSGPRPPRRLGLLVLQVRCFLLLLLLIRPLYAVTSYYDRSYSHYASVLATASLPGTTSFRRRRPWNRGSSPPFPRWTRARPSLLLLASTTTISSSGSTFRRPAPGPVVPPSGKGAAMIDETTPSPSYEMMRYEDLTWVGKVVAGTVEITVVTLMEYLSGLVGGYLLGTLTDLPRLFFRPLGSPDPSTTATQFLQQRTHRVDWSATPWWREMSGRGYRLHQKSSRWALQWAGVSAAFGGFRVATKVLRGGVEDEWNTVFSSMAAGAFFARSGGPPAMIRGALMYGGLMYLVSGGGLGGKREPFEYRERPVDF